MQNPGLYSKSLALNVIWWREWCKYVNFKDDLYNSAIGEAINPESPVPRHRKKTIKNFNDLIKVKRPDAINNKDVI